MFSKTIVDIFLSRQCKPSGPWRCDGVLVAIANSHGWEWAMPFRNHARMQAVSAIVERGKDNVVVVLQAIVEAVLSESRTSKCRRRVQQSPWGRSEHCEKLPRSWLWPAWRDGDAKEAGCCCQGMHYFSVVKLSGLLHFWIVDFRSAIERFERN